jgi:hypothetical protein
MTFPRFGRDLKNGHSVPFSLALHLKANPRTETLLEDKSSAPELKRDREKWVPVSGKDHASPN